MTLRRSKLRRELQGFFGGSGVQSASDAEERWSRAYDAYAREATDASGDKVATVNRPGFRRVLNFNPATGSAPAIAQQLDSAFVVYWTGAVFAIGKPPTPDAPCPSTGIFVVELTSVVIAVLPGVLAALLIPIFSNRTKSSTAAQQAAQVASAFHTATTSAVTVLISGTDAVPAPVTNTCTIF